jgi:hypothetical protein
VDLGEAHTVTGVKLNWEYARARRTPSRPRLTVDLADGVVLHDTGDGGVDDITFAAAADNPLRADGRHRPHHTVGLLTVGVPGLRHLTRTASAECSR